ncbi:MAG: hypothetical protein ACR650_12015 [Methylocystis sp.]
MNKILLAIALAGASLLAEVGTSEAYVCARGPYRAGCAGPYRGAVRGPHGAAIRGPYGGAAVRGPYGGLAVRHPYYRRW